MPLKGRLTDCEKHRIIAGLAGGLSILDLSKELGRDRRIVESYVKSPNTKSRKDKGEKKKNFTYRGQGKNTQATN